MKHIAFISLKFLLLLISFEITGQVQKPKPHLNHTAIFVTDLKTSKAFYENIIGLDTIPEPFHDGKHAWFTIGTGISLHIIQGADKKKGYYKNQHTCFSVPSVEAFAAILAKNNFSWEDVKGIKNAINIRVDGVKQLWVQDPDGYWVEINDAK
jgi:lactoylglutathione lyase